MLSKFMLSTSVVSRLALAMIAAALLLSACAADDPEESAAEETEAMAESTDAESGGDAAAASSVSFGGIADGDTVASPVPVTFEAEGFTIEEAGEVVDGAGHMHVMVDVGCVTPGEVIPDDDTHLHFGDGSTSAELELEPGEHALCLQAADGAHTALDLTDEVTITVE